MTPEPHAGVRASAPTGEVVVVGAINVDFVVAAEHLPRPGETVVGPRFERHGGGKGANAAVAAARAGATVRLVGAVGADDTGRSTIDELGADAIDVSSIAVLEGEATGVALIMVDRDGQNQIAVGAGANAAVTAQQVTRALRDAAVKPACVLVSTEIPQGAIAAAVEAATAMGVRCILNPAPVVPVVLELLRHGPLLTPNATELVELTARLDGRSGVSGSGSDGDRSSIIDGARKLVALTGAPVVVTMGGDGALIVDPDGRPEHFPAGTAKVRDTTGAGDTFNGVLVTRLASGDDLRTAVRTAIVAASLSVAHVGARAGMPTAARIASELGRHETRPSA